MKRRELLALAFVMFAALSTVVIVANAAVQPPEVRIVWLHALSLAQLVVGFVVYRKLAGDEAMRDFALRDWASEWRRMINIGVTSWVLAVAVVLALTERADRLFAGDPNIAWQLFYFLALIALPEEIIYRGIAMRIFEKRIALAVVTGALLFSLMHANNGLGFLPYYFAFGLLLGTLRRFGMTLMELAIWHGLFNFVNDTVWPATGFRTSAVAFFIVAPVSLLAITALVGWIGTESGKDEPKPEARAAGTASGSTDIAQV